MPDGSSRDRVRRPAARAPLTAFVLSGGGNQAVTQVGMLRALLERDIVPDVVVGTSAGALNGAAVATEPSLRKVDHLEEVWLGLTGESVFPDGHFKRVWNVLRRGDHLITSEGLRAVIEGAGPATTFEQLRIPLRVVAADLRTGTEVVLAAGPLRPALLASSALPGVYPPVEHAGHLLVDGAVVNVVPISHALSGPVERVYVLDVSGPAGDRPIRSPLDVLVRSFAITRNQRFELELANLRAGVDVVVLPRPADDRSFLDFSGAARLVDEAHRASARLLDELEAAGAGRRARAEGASARVARLVRRPRRKAG